MSVDYDASLMIGVALDDLYTVKKEKSQVTKYNQDTGKPYQQDVFTERYFWCGKEVEEIDDPYAFVEKLGLDITSSGGYSDNKYIVGKCLASADPGEIDEVTLSEFQQEFQEVKKKLQEQGYEGAIKLHLILSVD